MEYYSIVLSAGKGTRMHSAQPKVIHELLDSPMINLVLEELVNAGIKNNNVVVGYKKEEVLKVILDEYPNVGYVEQKEQLGTGHAVLQMGAQLKGQEGTTIITCGDTPLITAEIFQNLIKVHEQQKNDLTVLSVHAENPFGYGRIYRDQNSQVTKIIEQKDANEQEQAIQEVNSGVYCVNNKVLFEQISKINNNNKQQEYYLTDLISIFLQLDLKVAAHKIYDEESLMGINDLNALEKATQIFKERINTKHLLSGVKIIDKQNTYIGKKVTIEPGTIIFPNNTILGKTTIGPNNELKSGNVLENVKIGSNNQIGPMAYLRENSELNDSNRIGCFVEVKNTQVGKNSKAAHLSYLGDVIIGEDSNIGCGVITANYDGKNKNKTEIGNNVFIGSNVNLIAPLKIESGVFVAAGTTVTSNVKSEKFVIGRVRQEIKNKK